MSPASWLITPPFSPFFFNSTATTVIYTLSLHDALPILLSIFDIHDLTARRDWRTPRRLGISKGGVMDAIVPYDDDARSEEHTSELQSRQYLVCRLLLEKKKKNKRGKKKLTAIGA